jgi:hypothetical protein
LFKPIHRSFAENERGTGFDIFVRTSELHFMLAAPAPVYRPHLHELQFKLATMFWVQKHVVSGPYGFQHPRGDPEAFQASMNARAGALLRVENYWDFIRTKVLYNVYNF